MSTFDKEFDRLLGEAYFGGSPYERASGVKKQITFEARGPSTNKFDSHDVEYFSPEVAKFVKIYKEYYKPEESGGGAITSASTGPGSDIRNMFLNMFGDVEMYLQDTDNMLLYVVPERGGDMFDDPNQPKIKGMAIRAHHELSNSDVVTASSEGIRVNPGVNGKGALYGPVKTVSELLEENRFTMEIDIKRVDSGLQPHFDTFFPADIHGFSGK